MHSSSDIRSDFSLQPGTRLRQISLVIFDCDGVLVDSEYLSATVLIEVFADIGISIDLPFVYANFIGHSFSSVAAKFARLHGTNVPATFEDDYRNRLLQKFEGRLQAMPFVEAVLEDLGVPYCLASGSSPLRVAKSLEVTGLQPRFAGRIYTTSMVARGKPAPDVFLHVAKEVGMQPKNCLVIEDSNTGIEAAQAAGMAVWQFTGGAHFRHGYKATPTSHLVERRFDRMDAFFETVPELRRGQGT
jgi:HAD superfamily hydrolase (TIGR01509 family)